MVAVPDDFLRTVVFLCVEEPDEERTIVRVPKATGFFVRVPLDTHPAVAVDYLVTARHCVEEAMPRGQIWVRWNRKIGSFLEVPTRCEDWFLDNNSDVAAILMLPTMLPLDMSRNDFDTASLSLDAFVGSGPDYKYVGETLVGNVNVQPRVGHEVYFLGLFTQHHGQERNLPIARFGHIARMPSPVGMERPDGARFQSVAYLTEFHSQGGHSGSPVFFIYPMMIEEQHVIDQSSGQHISALVDQAQISGFLGLISGHYDIPTKAATEGDILGEIRTKLNSGIAFVTPAEAVRILLMREDVMAQREKALPFPL